MFQPRTAAVLVVLALGSVGFMGCPSEDESPAAPGADAGDARLDAGDTARDSGTVSAEDAALAADSGTAAGDAAVASDSGTAPDGAAGEGTPAPGKTTIEATLSKPVDGFAGTLEPFVGLEDGSSAKSDTSFNTYTANIGVALRRNIFISMPGVTPAEGMTYEFPFGDGIIKSRITYQELSGASINAYDCAGPLTFDSIVDKVHRFHFEVACTGDGGVTLTGTGVGTFE
jgi:hypothetical protein